MTDERYREPVAGLEAEDLGARLRASIADVQGRFPSGTGVCVFVFDFGDGGGLGYIANSDRADMIRALEEWIRRTKPIERTPRKT